MVNTSTHGTSANVPNQRKSVKMSVILNGVRVRAALNGRAAYVTTVRSRVSFHPHIEYQLTAYIDIFIY